MITKREAAVRTPLFLHAGRKKEGGVSATET